EFWATENVHQHSIRFKMDNKKHILVLESFRNMLHICPRFQGQTFSKLPFEEEIMDFIRHQNTQQYGAMLPIELINNEIRNNNAYKEYYAFATGEAAPKPKASARRKRSGSDTFITPLTATTTPKPNVAGDKSDEGEEDAGEDKNGDERDDDEENQEATKYDEQDDAEGCRDDEEEGESDEEDANEETRDEESFDPIPKTPEGSEDEGDGEEDQGLNVNKEKHVKEEEEDELYRDVNINQGRGLQVTLKVEDTQLRLILMRIIKEQVKGQVKKQVSRILPRIKQSVNAQLEAEVLTRSSHSSRTSYAVAADLSEMELKKILIEKMEGNKSIQRSDKQRSLYKALVNAYEADKIILDSYRETVILKRRRDDDDDKDEGPSAGSDRGSKRQREDRDWNKTLPAVQGSTQTWISELAKHADSRSSFNELLDAPLDFSNFIMNQLRVDTLTPKLLAGPTFELMKGSCKSLIELEYHLEEVYKAITDQLD
nr:hypothetical protein [Tanacetum cinerariifolium]